MKRLFVAIVFVSFSLSATPVSYFHIRQPVATVSGDYDQSGVFNATSFTVYGNYDGGARTINRIYCPSGGCGPVSGSQCVDAHGEILDQGRLQAYSVTVLDRSACF